MPGAFWKGAMARPDKESGKVRLGEKMFKKPCFQEFTRV
jgi:hypothetical protein